MNPIKLQLNAAIVSGDYSIKEIIAEHGYYNIGIVCDLKLYQSSPFVMRMIDNLKNHYDVYIKLYDNIFEPTYQYLDHLMLQVREKKLDQKLDVWIGIGGGSSMDTAKGLAFLCANPGPSIKYKGFPKGYKHPLPVIAIPSTVGSGSEVSFNACFIDEQSKTKLGINDKNNFPVVSILDPKIVSTAPRSVLATSACDALVHTLESFVSKRSNHVSRYFSIKAFHLIMENFPVLLDGKGDLTNWSNMQWAAVYAMWGLSNSSAGPAGALSYYLGTHFQVPHGTAGGIFIGKVSALNHRHGFHEYSHLYGWNPSHDHRLSRERKSILVVEAIQALLEKAGIPGNLAQFGINDSDRDGIIKFINQVQNAFDCNPVAFNSTDLRSLLV